ncbi:aquaporin-like protein [Rhexocercosporidium sp. MPI-PUGE-AT-0058]|nr:aquaporin-like protein [Rhexocercosporidium sp. MPI-PUGE-AT-0058]
MGEFVGTFMFLFFAFAGTQVANIGAGDSSNQSTTGSATGFNPATLLYIALSFGFSLMVNAWVFFRISGGLFNPAVTLALALLGSLSPLRAALLFIAQIAGATFSAYIVSILFPTAFNVRTTLASGTSYAQGVFIEAICTAELVFTIIMLAGEKHRATFIAPVGIGLALFIAELVAVYYTGGSLNPARSFAPCAVTHDFDGTHWIYWVGPLIGSLLAVGFYKVNKILEYEMVNPGQDGDVENDPTQNPDHEVAQAVEERAIEVEEIQAVEEEGGFDNLSTDGSVAALDPDVMEADPVADLDRHASGTHASTFSGLRKDDVEAQWPTTSEHSGR